MTDSTKKRNRGLRVTDAKGTPKVSIFLGKNTSRVHIDVKLTASEERALYEKLDKKFGKR